MTLPSNARATAPALVLILALLATGCGNKAADTASPPEATTSASATNAPAPTRATSAPTGGRKERITSAGIAAVVREHLGAQRVRLYGTYGGEPGSVDLMLSLRNGGGRDMFTVSAYSPGQGGGEFGELGRCPRSKKATRFMRHIRCHELPDGTTVLAYLVPSGFSDDNAHGQVVNGVSTSPDGSVALAMYESYDRSPAVSVADVDDLLSDRRLTWRTDPTVNDAGRDIKVRNLGG